MPAFLDRSGITHLWKKIKELVETRKPLQEPVADPTADGTTITAISGISQDANGVITVSKKTIADVSSKTSGLMTAAMNTKLAGIDAGANRVTMVYDPETKSLKINQSFTSDVAE